MWWLLGCGAPAPSVPPQGPASGGGFTVDLCSVPDRVAVVDVVQAQGELRRDWIWVGFWSGGLRRDMEVVTVASLVVQRALVGGSEAAELTVSGGAAEGVGMRAFHSPVLRTGERYLLAWSLPEQVFLWERLDPLVALPAESELSAVWGGLCSPGPFPPGAPGVPGLLSGSAPPVNAHSALREALPLAWE